MAVNLYKHNEDAYNSALKMLNTNGKAAIIHPTGTGKSFIGFKLCENFPDKTVCWMSPSDYIFKTQLENLKKASGGYEPQNVKFFTYAKLMNIIKLSDEKVKLLDKIGFSWQSESVWEKGYRHAKAYYEENGDLNVAVSYVCPDGFLLGEWLHSQRTKRKNLEPERVKLLSQTGAVGVG